MPLGLRRHQHQAAQQQQEQQQEQQQQRRCSPPASYHEDVALAKRLQVGAAPCQCLPCVLGAGARRACTAQPQPAIATVTCNLQCKRTCGVSFPSSSLPRLLAAPPARLQEEEDRRAAAAGAAEARLQQRFSHLEAAEAAAAARDVAVPADRPWARGFLGGLFGGRGQRVGSAGASAAAAAATAGAGGVSPRFGGPPRPTARGPRSQRSRRGPAAEAEFADGFAAFLPPNAGLQQLMMGMARGLPAHLLLRCAPWLGLRCMRERQWGGWMPYCLV